MVVGIETKGKEKHITKTSMVFSSFYLYPNEMVVSMDMKGKQKHISTRDPWVFSSSYLYTREMVVGIDTIGKQYTPMMRHKDAI
jgi:hypothetical protein